MMQEVYPSWKCQLKLSNETLKDKALQYKQQRKLKWTHEYMTEWRSNMIDKKIIPFVNDPICWPDDFCSQINNIRFGDYMYNMFLFLEEKKRNVGLKSLFMAMKPFYLDLLDPTKRLISNSMMCYRFAVVCD